MMLLYMLYSDVRCVAAHIPFSDAAFDQFSGSYSFVTLLRHPVERFISNYFWSHKHPDGVQHVSESLEEFIGTDRARRLGSTYARYFSGEPAADEFTSKHADAAVRNLKRMHLVGFLDDLGRFQGGLRSLTKRRIKIGKENVGHNSSERDRILSGPLKEQILDACAIDLAIWEQIEDLRSSERFAQLEKSPADRDGSHGMTSDSRVLTELIGFLTGKLTTVRDWRAIVAMAGSTLTIGNFAEVALGAGPVALPSQYMELLQDIRTRARERNNRLKQQLAEVLPALNDAGVEPVVMKGMARMLCSRQEQSRLLADIDILVPHDRRELARMRSFGLATAHGWRRAGRNARVRARMRRGHNRSS